MEHPILFSGPMMRAVLEGRKTQTRRVVKGTALGWLAPNMFDPSFVASPENNLCPYGQPGDLLWVRETWGAWPSLSGGIELESLRFRADGEYQNEYNAWQWRPSIHMPRSVCRLTLRITEERVQRVQEITEEEAKAEGVEKGAEPLHLSEQGAIAEGENGIRVAQLIANPPVVVSYRIGFRKTWDSINAKRGYSWDSNPWVWAISFEKESK